LLKIIRPTSKTKIIEKVQYIVETLLGSEVVQKCKEERIEEHGAMGRQVSRRHCKETHPILDLANIEN